MTTTASTRTLRLAILGSAVWAWPMPAMAQQAGAPVEDASATGIADIVVTAQRREESVQDVPIAITAFSAAELAQRNVVDALDVMQYVPNVVSSNNVGLGSANTYFIRGLGSTDSIATADPAVGTYVDDIYVGRQSANNLSLFDVERVEVLRGPQGTLFGRNTTGGAISIVLAKPGRELGGFVEGGVGSYGRRAVRGSIDLPLGPNWSTKLTGYYNTDRGYVRNITTGERLNGQQTFGARLASDARISDNLTWTVAGLYTQTTAANVLNFDCNPAAPAECDGRFASTGLRRDNNGSNQVAPLILANGKGNLPLGAETRFGLVSSNLSLDIGSATLSAITGFVRTEQDFLVDFFDGRGAPALNFGTDASGRPTRFNTGTNVNLFPVVRGSRTGGFNIANVAVTNQFSQEIKLNGVLFDDRVTYVVGAFYFNERSRTDFADTLTGANGIPILLADRIVRNKTEAIAGYAQVDVAITDTIKVTGGIRYTDERRSADFSDNRAICQTTPLPLTCLDSRNFASVDVDLNAATPNIAIPLNQKVKIWTPRVALNYRPSDDILLFASATRGFKSGAQAARATAVRQLLVVGPEKVWSYELGAKTDLFDRRLRFNVTGFYQDNQDFQGGTAFVNPTTGALSFVTRNLADLKNKGVEVEIVARPVPPLTLTLAGGYQDIRYEIDPTRPNIDSLGFLSPFAQRAECRAAIAGQASPLALPGTATARAQGNCSGIVTSAGELAKPVRSPELTGSFTAAYAIGLPSLGASLTPSVSLIYTSSQEVGTNNLSGYVSASGVANIAGDGSFVLGSFSRAHTLVNANLTLATDDRGYSLALSCSNCGNISFPQSTLSNFSYLNEPRTVALDLRVRF